MILLRYVHSVFGFWFVFIVNIHFDNGEIYDDESNTNTVTIPYVFDKSKYDEVKERLSRFTLKRISKAPKSLGIQVHEISEPDTEKTTAKEKYIAETKTTLSPEISETSPQLKQTKTATLSPEILESSPQMKQISEMERNEIDFDTLNNYDYDEQTLNTDQIRKVLNKQVQLITNFFQIMKYNKDDKRQRKRHRDFMLRQNNDNDTENATKSPEEIAKDALFATFNLTSKEAVDTQSHPVNVMMVSQGAVKNALRKDQLVQRILKIYKEKRSDYLKRTQGNS